jgi:ABC-2 type transport system ATP-binding protein
VKETKADGRTVFFSSHILSEVQAVCDRVGIIRDGQLVATQRVDDLFAQRMNRLTMIFEGQPPAGVFNFEGVSELDVTKQSITLEVRDNLPAVLSAAASHDVMDIETHNISLEEIFLTYYSKEEGGDHV